MPRTSSDPPVWCRAPVDSDGSSARGLFVAWAVGCSAHYLYERKTPEISVRPAARPGIERQSFDSPQPFEFVTLACELLRMFRAQVNSTGAR